jgi:hypothetical protein
MERTHRLLRDPSALTFDRSQMAPTRESEFTDGGSVPLFLSEPDPRHFASTNPSRPTTNLTRIAVVGLAGLTFAIILAAVSYSDVTRVIVDKARSAAAARSRIERQSRPPRASSTRRIQSTRWGRRLWRAERRPQAPITPRRRVRPKPKQRDMNGRRRRKRSTPKHCFRW